MEQDKNLTVWQRLTKAFGPNSLLNQDYPTYKFDKTELLKTTSKQEYEREKLQAQQTYFLGNQWAKIETNLYSQAVYYEPTRLATFFDLESMEFCLHGDTKIATPDGFITIKELADKGRDNEFIVYSYDHNEKRVIPAKARNAHYTRDEMTYKITFDDGNHIIATWEHQLMMRDGSFERVMNLKPGDSMMPFYRKSFYGKDKYHWVYSCNSKVGHHGWVSEHNLIAEWYYRPLESNEVVHHRDFNGKNNNPENLLIMDKFEHQSYHAKINNEKLWANPEYREKMKIVARSKKNFSWNGRRAKENNPAYFSIPFDNIIETARQHKTLKKTAVALGVSHVKIQRDIVNAGYKDWSTFLEAYNIEKSKYSTAKAKGDQLAINHKIVSIEPFGVVPVYDITVPGYKNFATDTIFSHNTPEISAALDIYSEESTTVDENGYMLQIYSESKRIKSVLADLFNNVLDINTNLPMWIRNMTKYGDNFVYLKLDPEKGIVGCTQLPNIEIERFERGMAAKSINTDEPIENKGLRFKWKAKDMEFNTWEIAHFRLLGDDRKLPYGTSMLEKARRVWKQLCVSENTKVWTIDGYKKIKDIKAGEIIYSYDFDNNELISTKVKDCWQSGVKKTFNVRTRYNSIDITDDHQVLVYCDGEYTYKTLGEFNIGQDRLITPTINNNKTTKTITLNSDNYYIKLNEKGVEKSKNINREGVVKQLKEINEKDYKNIHRFLQGGGKVKYDYIDKIIEKFNFEKDDFDLYYHNTKSLVSIDLNYTIDSDFIKFFGFMLGDGWLTTNGVGFALGVYDEMNDFYINYVKENLKEKLMYNSSKVNKYSKSVVVPNKEIKNIFLSLGFITGFANKRIPSWVYGMDLQFKRSLINGLFDADGSDKYGVIGLANEGLINDLKELCLQSGIACGKIGKTEGKTKFNEKTGKYEIRQDSFKLYINFNNINDDVRYEKIIDITENDDEPVWDLEVESELHNFIANGSVVHNCLAEDAMLIYRTSRAPERRVFKVFVGNMDDKDVEAYVQRVANKFKRDQVVDSASGNVDMRFNQMAVDQDYFIPVRDPAAPTPIDTLPGAANLGDIQDIEYIQKKLLTALRVPKAFLGFEEPVGGGKDLSLMDIRFARTINKIQKCALAELNKIAIIHLFLLGFEDELRSFTLNLTNPSSQADLLKIDVWKEKMLLYKDAVTPLQDNFAPVSASWAKKHILGFSDEEIRLDLQQQRIERAVAAELTNTATVITHTGLFDNIDKLYGTKTGGTQSVTATPPPPPTGEPSGIGSDMGLPPMPPPPGPEVGGEAGVTPEGRTRDNLSILVENSSLLEEEQYIDLSKARNSLGDISQQLDKLLND